MRYAILFSLLAALLVLYAFQLQGAYWLLLWPGISFLWVALAYAGLGPCLLGKRADGRMAGWATLPLLPYLILTWGLWHFYRLLSKEDAWNEVAPGLFLGRRAFARELPPNVTLVVDLTSEFPEPRGVLAGRAYVCLPILDAHVPGAAALRDLAGKVAGWPGSVYVHCAMGHGRSALVVAAVLLMRGLAKHVSEAEALVRKARPRARLRHSQFALCSQLAPRVDLPPSTRGAS